VQIRKTVRNLLELLAIAQKPENVIADGNAGAGIAFPREDAGDGVSAAPDRGRGRRRTRVPRGTAIRLSRKIYRRELEKV
jgi:hypothetical protein